MLIVLSPAKNLNFDAAPSATPVPTKPVFLKEARGISAVAKDLSVSDLKKLMGISDALAELNHERFQTFRGDGRANVQKPAALAFNGDVYLGLDAKTFDTDDFAFAQDHVRILSGLYGLLKPLDYIEPYRLEMGSRLKNPSGNNLYAYWGDAIAKEINKSLNSAADATLVNLASKEYFSAVDPVALRVPVVAPQFKEEKDGKLRQLQFFAKRARGLMARWAVQNRITRAEDLKDFDVDGYRFDRQGSDETDWLFTRPQPAPVSLKKASAKKPSTQKEKPTKRVSA
ncbi:MAG: peroxide stress protein YaaA [Pseudomonadota bacterium]